MSQPEYNPAELLICLAARLMEDGATAFIGTGIPMLAASLAQRMQAPRLVPVFEFGGTGAILEKLPLAVGDMRTFHKGLVASGICDIMETAQRGFVEYGFLGGAQIDRYGNLNSTVIGPHETPKVRLPGSGGANDVGSSCWRTIAIMRHGKQRFVETCDFVTTPGYLTGPGARERAGLPAGSGPYRVVSNLGVMGYDEDTKEMTLLSVNPGVTVEQVLDETGFPMRVAPRVDANPPPTAEELRILREQIDPDRLYI
ncbi:MAG: 3-oxoacid CoA-transferase [Deltaproteobacteria bacterium]|nr:3-oxoacid CoA-transferase [Deltaproteobacteria bacterium]